jgi:Kef-type K+ transport system membrane component KefB
LDQPFSANFGLACTGLCSGRSHPKQHAGNGLPVGGVVFVVGYGNRNRLFNCLAPTRQRPEIAFGHIVFPVAIALAVVAILPVKYMGNPDQRILYSIFMATVMNISALSVIAKMLQDLRLLKPDLGFLIISALTVNEVFGWVIHTIVLGIASQETFLMQKAVWVFVITVCLAVLILTVGRRISTNLFEAVHWSRLPEPSSSFTITVLLALLLGAIAQKLGIHSLYGYFLAVYWSVKPKACRNKHGV